jgi:hypothetical protein
VVYRRKYFCGLAAYNPSNLELIGYTNGIAPGQKIEDVAFDVGGYIYGYVTIDATGVNNPNNGANEVVVVIDGHNGQVNIGNVFWTIYTYGTGTFDAWALGRWCVLYLCRSKLDKAGR